MQIILKLDEKMAYKKSEIPDPQVLGPFIKHYLVAKSQISVTNGNSGNKESVSAATIKAWSHMLKRLEGYANKKRLKYVHSLTGNHLSDFINKEYQNTGNNTKRVIISYLNTFFDFAESSGACIDNEARRLSRPKYINKEADYLNEQELSQWLETVKNTVTDKLFGRDMLIASLLIFPGLRVEELVSLEIANIDLSSKSLSIKVKGGDVLRKPISDESKEYLAFWLQTMEEKGIDSEWVFPSKRSPGQHLSTRAIEYLVEKYLRKAGIIKRTMGPHLIRHSGGSYLLKKGADIRTVQKMLGHKKLSTTEKYVHTDFDDMVAAGVRLNGLFKSSEEPD